MTERSIVRRVGWRFLYHPGAETMDLTRSEEGWRLSGVGRYEYPEGPTDVEYTIDCDPAWRTREAHIRLRQPRTRRSLWISADGAGGWEVGGMRRAELRGCLDLDLTVTPATNTLPIRRLDLAVGEDIEILAAWIQFPELEVNPARQRYTRTARQRYRYEGLDNGFVAEFDVDDLGLVINYPGYWERVALETLK